MTRGQHVIAAFVLSYLMMTLTAADVVQWSLIWCTAPLWILFLVGIGIGVYESLKQ